MVHPLSVLECVQRHIEKKWLCDVIKKKKKKNIDSEEEK